MKSDIVRFIRKACAHYKMQALWVPDNDCYFIHKNGRAIQSFTTKDFYDMPKKWRFFSYLPLINVGLNNNLSEKTKDSLIGLYKLGKKIY